jgi:hypothetical protein
MDCMQCREDEGKALGVNHDGKGCVCCRHSVLALTCTEQQERVNCPCRMVCGTEPCESYHAW